MKGTQISPWSIYNQQLINNLEEGKTQIDLVLPPIKAVKPHQERELPRRRSLLKQYSRIQSIKQTNEVNDPYIPESRNMRLKSDYNITDMIQTQQKELQRVIEKRVILQIIAENLKSQINPNQSQQKMEFNFPKFNLEKYMAAMGLQDQSRTLDTKIYSEQPNSQKLKGIIKDEIKSRIKSKMIIMGQCKNISRK